jgi:homoserine O-acetyltransferase
MRRVLLALATILTLHGDLRAQDGAQKIADLGACQLSSGKTILNCKVGYRIFGTLNADRTNVVVMPSWLNGRSEDLVNLFGDKPARSRVVDTTKFFGIAFDAFGNGVSSSPSNSTQQHGTAFPEFTLADAVRAQHRVLTEVLKVKHVHAVLGLSMGGHQTFAWSILYPSYVSLAAPIVGSPQATNFDRLSKQIVIDAISSDPDYKNGNYTTEPALKLANEIGYQMLTTPLFRNSEAKRSEYSEWLAKIEKPQRQDANDRIWQAKAIIAHDLLQGKTMEEAARETPVKFLVIVGAEDRMVTPAPALAWAKAKGDESYVSHGECSHLIMDCDADAVRERVQRFLDQP